MFYVDSYTRELVKERDSFAPPERYYEYRRGVNEGIIIETYVASYNPLQLLDFAHVVGDPMTGVARQNHFDKHGVSQNAILYAYTVPPTWYDEETAKYEGRSITE